MFKSKNTKIMYTPVNPNFTIQQLGVRGSTLPSVKGITSTSYFSALFKNTTFRVMERKFLCSGDVLDLADLTDKAKWPSQHLIKQIHEVLKSCPKHNR